MWTRNELKMRAKEVLKTSYWKAFLASMLLALITGGIPSCSLNLGDRKGEHGGTSSFVPPGTFNEAGDEWNGALLAVILIGIVVAIVIVLVVIALNVFVTSPLKVGVWQYFKQAAQDDVNMNYLGYSFEKGKYMPVVKGMLWMGFLNFLWYLLLIVPGIIKTYAYSMVPYILADNPHIGTKRAVELSNQMTRGQKWRMFVLDLSFLGWYLLGFLAFAVGLLFVWPYVYATQAELYLALRQKALNDGVCGRDELGLPDMA